MGYFDAMQVCLNGHLINDTFHDNPVFNKNYCDKCGAATMSTCPSCKKEIKGKHHYERVVDLSGIPTPVPTICEYCGKPFPWSNKMLKSHNMSSMPNTPNGLVKLYKESVKNVPILKYSWVAISAICILALTAYFKLNNSDVFIYAFVVLFISFLAFALSYLTKIGDKFIKAVLYFFIFCIVITMATGVVCFGTFIIWQKPPFYKRWFPDQTRSDSVSRLKDNAIANGPGHLPQKSGPLQIVDVSFLRENAIGEDNQELSTDLSDNNDTLDIKLRTTGSEVSYAKRIELKIIKCWKFVPNYTPDYTMQKPSAEYLMRLELDPNKIPDLKTKSISQVIKPGDADRILLALRSDCPGDNAYIFQVDLSIVYDEDNKITNIQTIFLAFQMPFQRYYTSAQVAKEDDYSKGIYDLNMKNADVISRMEGIKSFATKALIAHVKNGNSKK